MYALLFLAVAAAEALVSDDHAGDACLAHVNAIRKKHNVPPYTLLGQKYQKCTAQEAEKDQKSGKAHGSFPMCGEYAQGVAGGSCIKAIDAFMSEWPCKNCHASGVISSSYHSFSYGQYKNHVSVNYYYCPKSPCDPPKASANISTSMIENSTFIERPADGMEIAAAATLNTSAEIPKGMLSAVAADTLTEQAGGNGCQLPPASPPPSTGKFSRQECLSAINKYRGMKGLSHLKLCSAERQTLADRMVQYDGDRHAAHSYFKNCCGVGKGGTGQCEAGRFGSAARAVEAYWNEGPPKKGGFNHYSIMMKAQNTCVACGFSQKNYDLGNKHQTWTYVHNFYSDDVSEGSPVINVLV